MGLFGPYLVYHRALTKSGYVVCMYWFCYKNKKWTAKIIGIYWPSTLFATVISNGKWKSSLNVKILKEIRHPVGIRNYKAGSARERIIPTKKGGVCHTSPKAPLPMTLSGSKSSHPNLDLLSLRNSVSFEACCSLFSTFWSSGMDSALRVSSSLCHLSRLSRLSEIKLE